MMKSSISRFLSVLLLQGVLLTADGLESVRAQEPPRLVAAISQGAENPATASMESLAEALSGPRASRAEAIPPQTALAPFLRLAVGGPADTVKLTGISPTKGFEFVMRRDEIVTAAELMLFWTPSPSLLPVRSQLVVRLNGQVQKVFPIAREMLGKKNRSVIALDPEKLKDVNTIELEFIGEYDYVCTTPASPTLWLTIDDGSQLSLSRQKLRVADDLSLFPVPFADPNDKNVQRIGFAFDASPSEKELSAAAVLASYFGKLADWRGADFPAYFDLIPAEGHFIAFYTPEHHPEFLKNWPKPQGAEIAVADAPLSPWAKMLVISGRTEDELLEAARAVASGTALLSGSRILVREAVQVEASKPYDAPKWIDTTRITTFGQLADYPGALTTRGKEPWPVRLTLRLPPDLFVVNRSSVPVHLRYRYSLPEPNAQAQLRFRVNDALVDSRRLTDKGQSESIDRVAVVDSVASIFESFAVPTILFGAVNTLEFDFRYALSIYAGTPDNCRTVTLIDQQGEIDPRSTIDFTGFYHYAQMPNLSLFALSGFPFTRLADFSETLFVLTQAPSESSVQTLLNAAGRLGGQTGAAGLAADVRINPAAEAMAGRDLLVVGNLPGSLPESDEEAPGLIVQQLSRRLLSSRGEPGPDAGKKLLSAPEERISVLAAGTLAAIAGFESPFTEGRSVVALLSANDKGAARLNERLANPAAMRDAAGSVTFLREEGSLNLVLRKLAGNPYKGSRGFQTTSKVCIRHRDR